MEGAQHDSKTKIALMSLISFWYQNHGSILLNLVLPDVFDAMFSEFFFTLLLIPWQFNILSCFSLCAIGDKWENRERGKDICDSFKHNTIPFYILLNIVQTPCMLPTQ